MENQENNNGNLEKKVENILISKTKLVYGIIVATLIVGSLFFKIQMDVALIRQNHAAHIEQIMGDIKELKEKDIALVQENKDLMELLIDYNSKLDTLIGQMNEHVK
jgi:hypothetical protein